MVLGRGKGGGGGVRDVDVDGCGVFRQKVWVEGAASSPPSRQLASKIRFPRELPPASPLYPISFDLDFDSKRPVPSRSNGIFRIIPLQICS